MLTIIALIFSLSLSVVTTLATLGLAREVVTDLLPEWHEVKEIGKLVILFFITLLWVLAALSLSLWGITIFIFTLVL